MPLPLLTYEKIGKNSHQYKVQPIIDEHIKLYEEMFYVFEKKSSLISFKIGSDENECP